MTTTETPAERSTLFESDEVAAERGGNLARNDRAGAGMLPERAILTLIENAEGAAADPERASERVAWVENASFWRGYLAEVHGPAETFGPSFAELDAQEVTGDIERSPHVIELEETNARAHAALTLVQQLRDNHRRWASEHRRRGLGLPTHPHTLAANQVDGFVTDLDRILAAFEGRQS